MIEFFFISKFFLPRHPNAVLIAIRVPVWYPNVSQSESQNYDLYQGECSEEIGHVIGNINIEVVVRDFPYSRLDGWHVIVRVYNVD